MEQRFINKLEPASIALRALTRKRSLHIVQYIEDHPGCSQKDLITSMGEKQCNIQMHINDLECSGLIDTIYEGRKASYTINFDRCSTVAAAAKKLIA